MTELRKEVAEKIDKFVDFLILNNCEGCTECEPKTTARSCPFAFYFHSDVVHLAVDLGVHIPEIYGDVVISEHPNEFGDYEYSTTGEQRTGCSMCGFGIQLEERPHRFDRLYERSPKEWDFWMMHCCKHEDGSEYGWGEVLDYIGIPWRDPEHWWLASPMPNQMSLFDYMADDFLIENLER